jgi:hypothetical protein
MRFVCCFVVESDRIEVKSMLVHDKKNRNKKAVVGNECRRSEAAYAAYLLFVLQSQTHSLGALTRCYTNHLLLLCDTFTTIDLTHFFLLLLVSIVSAFAHYILPLPFQYIITLLHCTLYTVALHYITFSINTYTSHTPPNPSNRRQSVAIPPTL